MARILVVDDTKEILDLARFILAGAGHEVITVESAMDAMEALNTYRADLGIFDIEMPYTNGFQLAQTLRNSLRYKFFPIIFLTVRKEKKDVERAAQVSAEGYVLKPIQKEKLLEAVDFVLKKIPPTQYPNIELSQTILSENAQIIKKENIKIKSISDIGILAIATHKLLPGDTVEIKSSLFSEVDIPAVPFKVLGSKERDDKTWEITLSFLGLSYESIQKLRGWILAQDIKKYSA